MALAGTMPRGQNQVAIRLCAVGRAPSQAAHFALAQRGELGIGVENRRELAICRVDPNKRSGMRRRLARADNCLRDRLTSQQRIRRRENYVRLDLAIGSPPPERGGSSVLRCPRLEKVERTILPPDGADGFAARSCTAHELLVSDQGSKPPF